MSLEKVWHDGYISLWHVVMIKPSLVTETYWSLRSIDGGVSLCRLDLSVFEWLASLVSPTSFLKTSDHCVTQLWIGQLFCFICLPLCYCWVLSNMNIELTFSSFWLRWNIVILRSCDYKNVPLLMQHVFVFIFVIICVSKILFKYTVLTY